MKAFTTIWLIMAAFCIIAVITGGLHHIATATVCCILAYTGYSHCGKEKQ